MLAANKMGGRFNMQALRWASKELRGDKEVVLAAAQQDADAPRWTSKELQKDGRSCWLLTNKDKHVDVEVCTQENKASEIKSQSTNPTCVHTLHTSPRSGPGPGIAIPHVPGLARPLAVLQCYGVTVLSRLLSVSFIVA